MRKVVSIFLVAIITVLSGPFMVLGACAMFAIAGWRLGKEATHTLIKWVGDGL